MCRINFDMDGTIANFYGVDNWLEYLMNEDTTPYEVAKPLMNFSLLARYLNRLQREGHEIAIISWCSKGGSDSFNNAIMEAKQKWLNSHLPSVQFNEITIVPYGTPKERFKFNAEDILFDDEQPNRTNWGDNAHRESEIMEVLKALLD